MASETCSRPTGGAAAVVRSLVSSWWDTVVAMRRMVILGNRIAAGVDWDRRLARAGRAPGGAASLVWETVIAMVLRVMLADCRYCCCHRRLGGAQLVKGASVASESALKIWHERGREGILPVFYLLEAGFDGRGMELAAWCGNKGGRQHQILVPEDLVLLLCTVLCYRCQILSRLVDDSSPVGNLEPALRQESYPTLH